MGQHSFQAEALCPSLASGWFSACPEKEKVKFQMGKREHTVVDHKPFSSVNTDFSLAPVQKHCLSETQQKVKYSAVLGFFFFNCFQKFMFLPGVCAILNTASFSGVWVRAGADQMEAGACPGHRISLCIPWLSGCVLGGGSRLPHFPHGSENPALCYGTVS